MSLPEGKRKGLEAVANRDGVIAALAMDQRTSLLKAFGADDKAGQSELSTDAITEFKSAVSQFLAPHASAILLDPEYGLEAARLRGPNTGLLLAYDQSGYDNSRPGRLPDLLPHVSARRIVDWGADAVKILMYYSPFEGASINDIKHAFIERVGAECAALDTPFFLELLGYDTEGGDVKGFAYARRKPEVLKRSMSEFSKSVYGVDILKVEIPVNTTYVEGSRAYQGQKAYTKTEALEHFRAAAEHSAKPFIYLSAGVTNEQFVESLEMAAEAGADFSGVLCGRATWRGGIAAYATGGRGALEEWLTTEGVRNIKAVNEAVKAATPWTAKGS